jgi:predicted regulator of Ras-like GTPase activity (Roadblock/LC7/MglB family)
MTPEFMAKAVEDIPSLRAVFVIAMPDCLLFGSWLHSGSDWAEEEVASYFGDLFRANREGLKALESWSHEIQISIDSPGYRLLLQELNNDFVCVCVFERDAALGMVRLYTKKLLQRMASSLPDFEAEERPRGVRVMNFLSRYAPDPHAVLMRVSLQAKLPMDLLEQPERLSVEQAAQVETTACRILGIEAMSL